jgi:hypothetical protein
MRSFRIFRGDRLLREGDWPGIKVGKTSAAPSIDDGR